jgi:hypothetical protein
VNLPTPPLIKEEKMIITTEETRTAESRVKHEHIVRRAQTELNVLLAEEAEHRAKLQSIAAELETIRRRVPARQELRDAAESTLQHATAAHTAASTRVKLLEGTEGHSDALEASRTAKRNHIRIRAESAAMKARLLEERATDQSKEATLQAEQATRSERLHTISQERAAYLRAQYEAQQAIGEIEYAEVRERLAAKREQLANAKQAAMDLEQEERLMIAEGVQQLGAWSDLAEKMRAEGPSEDTVTNTLAAFAKFLELLVVNNGHDLGTLARVPTVSSTVLNWRYLFMIPLEDLATELATPLNQPNRLIHRRVIAEQVLDEYRNLKK